MERALEAVRIGDVGLNAASSAYPLRKLPEEALEREKLFCGGGGGGGGTHIAAERKLVIFFTVGAIHVLYNHH